jgi:hypothetical protein
MMEFFLRARGIFAITLGLLVLAPVLPGSAAAEQNIRGVSAQINIMAQPALIYENIKSLGKTDGSVKVLETNPEHSVLEETFKGLPIIGDAVCVYEERYDQNRRIDYHLLRSDKFKAFEGGWELAPAPDGSTLVKLRHYTDTGLRIPFARQITDGATMKDIQKRLSVLKQQAESKH